MSRLSTLALVITVTVACGGKSTPPPTTPLPDDKPAEPVVAAEPAKPEPPPAPPGPVEVPIESAPVTVKLVKAGGGKKAKLVYVAKAGDKTPLEIAFDFVQKVDSAQEKQEVIMPTVVLQTEAETKAADATTIDYALNITGIDARDVTGSQIKADQVKQQLGGVTGLTIAGKVNANGTAAGSTIVRLEKADDAGKQVVGLVQNALPTWPPLPAEAIGVGAKWQATTTSSVMGQLTVTQVTDYELVSRKGTTSTIKGTIKVTGTDLMKDGAKITDIKGTGTTEATLTDGAFPMFKSNVDTSFKVTDASNSSGTIGVKIGTAITPKLAVAATPAPAAKK